MRDHDQPRIGISSPAGPLTPAARLRTDPAMFVLVTFAFVTAARTGRRTRLEGAADAVGGVPRVHRTHWSSGALAAEGGPDVSVAAAEPIRHRETQGDPTENVGRPMNMRPDPAVTDHERERSDGRACLR